MENQWKISGKSVEKHGKVWANPWENHHKSIGQENDDLKQGNLGGVFSGGLSHKKWGGGARKWRVKSTIENVVLEEHSPVLNGTCITCGLSILDFRKREV